MTYTTPRTRLRLAAAGLAATTLVAGLATLPAFGSTASPAGNPLSDLVTWGDSPAHAENVDTRGVALPTAAQRRAVAGLGATVRWNDFGTPASMLPLDGSLGAATSSNAVDAARAWMVSHRTVLGLSLSQVKGLELVNNQKFAQSPARAVLFRQRYGSLVPAIGGLVTVGVANGQIAYVSSSLTRPTESPAPAVLDSKVAWLKAAASVGLGPDLAAIQSFEADQAGWDRLRVAGLVQEQQVRLRALGMADGSVRPAYVANVTNVAGGEAQSYTVSVDAVTGRILHRDSNVDHADTVTPVEGEVKKESCGEETSFTLTDDKTRTISFVATTAVAAIDDIELKLYGPGHVLLATEDVGTSPEAMVYTAPYIAQGDYSVTVCDFGPTSVSPLFVDSPYAGVVVTSDESTPSANLPSPKWGWFAANPTINFSTTHVPGNRVVGCWTMTTGCSTLVGPIANGAARGPWDMNVTTGFPTFTTIGNAADTREAWISPLTPGGLFQAPVSADREYLPPFNDEWQNSKCDPTNLVPGGNDIDAAVANLFSVHNRMHDFSYYLGFTETNYNLQTKNYGANSDLSRENDPEVGNVQAGAIGGLQSGLGRDNANQITLQDGIPGITNQYLFQPIAGAFYSPCTDGDFDMSIVGHEYTHAITNRMIGGPDDSISSEQGGAMGESWGDLTAGEYLWEHGFPTGVNPWAVGPYATGNASAGIRDYPINKNPLQYGDYGFDSTGPEVHADGEIWNGTMWDVREILVDEYDAKFPYSNKALQKRCAVGTLAASPLAAQYCPGNRRWIQLMFDGFLLQQGATSMLDARDSMIAADRMRFGGANQKELWLAFARDGMGVNASTANADSHEPRPGYIAPGTASAKVTLKAVLGSTTARGSFYLGHYEARATPVADTLKTTKLDQTIKLAPGRYELLFAGKGTGLTRSTLTVKAGQTLVRKLGLERNLASLANGAKVVRTSDTVLNANFLIDDTEATNWAGLVPDGGSIDASNPYVVIDLAGGKQTIRTARVSAMLRPAPATDEVVPLLAGEVEDPNSGKRFTALRKFAIDVCVQSAGNDCASAKATWKRIYVSPASAFPGARPRPVAPNLTLRGFDIPDMVATHVRFVALENQCTGFAGYAGDQDADPTNDTDCKSGSVSDESVRAAEFQVF